MWRPKTASVGLNVDAGRSHCCVFFLFFFSSLWHTFGSFLVTKDGNVNPFLLPFIQWENAEPAFTRLAAGYW